MKNHGHPALTTQVERNRSETHQPLHQQAHIAARDRSKITLVLDPRGIAMFSGNVQANLADSDYGKVADVPGFGRVYPNKASLSALGWFAEPIRKVVMARGPVVIRREDVPANLRHLLPV